MDEDKYMAAQKIYNYIQRIEREFRQLAHKSSEEFRHSVRTLSSIDDPLGDTVILKYPSKEAADSYKVACVNALRKRLRELKAEFDEL